MQRALWEQPVNYAAVAATQGADFLRYPPTGYRPIERRGRIGHGDARFQYAWHAALSWGIQKGAGFGIEPIDAPPEVRESTYVPISFDTGGTPIPSMTLSPEDMFGPDGTAFAAPGDTVFLVTPLGPFSFKSPVRVVYLVDEPKRKGFAYGTLDGHPETGEEAFIVEQKDDGSVWLTVRAFSRPSTRFWRAMSPILRIMQEIYTRRYLRALAVPMSGE